VAAGGWVVKQGDWQRIVLITLDGVGAGALPDARNYGDAGASTLQHVADACGGLSLPHLQKLGLGNILPIAGVPPVAKPAAAFGRMRELSAGKDTITGHWEIAGIITPEPFPTFPAGFPSEIIDTFRRQTGLDPLGNEVASGTEIIRRLGEEHLRSGRPIVYTSADSVFQIAAHEEIIPLQRLYEICRVTRGFLERWRVLRVIARPFIGRNADDFRRTANRHDFPLPPPALTILDRLKTADVNVIGIGKIHDIYAGRGLTAHSFTTSNTDGMEKTLTALADVGRGVIFTNLVDFDMLFGHRQDAAGFGAALMEFDAWLPRLLKEMTVADLLLLTADHGCDPTTAGTDHTREHAPLLAWSPRLKDGIDLGIRDSFADIAATLAEAFLLKVPAGKSLLPAFD
jgi:phosphopentomutase